MGPIPYSPFPLRPYLPPMQLLLVRHAHAGARDPMHWPDDRLRPLTDRGRSTIADVSRGLRELKLVPEAVLTSPWARARQTADLLIEHLELSYHASLCEPLAAAPRLDALQEHIGTRAPESLVALVGHSPWMEELGSLLIAGRPDTLGIDFPKSGVLVLELDRLESGAAALRAFLRPSHLRKIGRVRK